MTGGQLYLTLFNNYGQKPEDFKKALNYYERAFMIGPKLPPVLYGLFNLYIQSGQKDKAKEIGQIILNYWPDNDQIRGLISSL